MIARETTIFAPYAQEVHDGLANRPRTLPPKLFYDLAGSALFEQITRLPEYYLTRTELEILQERAGEIVSRAGQCLTVVELGAGTAAKTLTLLAALQRRQLRVEYFPVDISPAALAEARKRVEGSCPGLYIHPVIADFSDGFCFLRSVTGRKLVLFLGSSIGNLHPVEAASTLRKVHGELTAGDALLIGTDLAKDPAILLPAYDDAQGVTAVFNKNILRRINRELHADFEVDAFRHVASWDPDSSRIEMYLESMRSQRVNIRNLRLNLKIDAGERIHTENSYKYTTPMIYGILDAAGFALEETWLDRKQWYAVHLARV